jgi:hypothetical protein
MRHFAQLEREAAADAAEQRMDLAPARMIHQNEIIAAVRVRAAVSCNDRAQSTRVRPVGCNDEIAAGTRLRTFVRPPWLPRPGVSTSPRPHMPY